MIDGSRSCGVINFNTSETPKMMVTCHCTRCRKIGPSTFVFVTKNAFYLFSGAEKIATFEPSPPHKYNRTFCRRCGTALSEIGSEADVFPVAANCLNTDPGLRNSFHDFFSEKPNWLSIGDDAPQYEHHPPKQESATS